MLNVSQNWVGVCTDLNLDPNMLIKGEADINDEISVPLAVAQKYGLV